MPLTAVRFESHALCLPLAGVREPSDAAVIQTCGAGLLAILIDPCGQGQSALVAAKRAVVEIGRGGPGLAGLFPRIHRAVLLTQGVSVGAALIDPVAGRFEFAGIGRVYGAVATPSGIEVLASDQGTLGVGLPRSPSVVSLPWQSGSTLVLAADGLVDAWDLTQLRHGLSGPLESLGRRLGGYQHRMPEDASVVLVREKA